MIDPVKKQVLDLFAKGRGLYKERKFAEARQLFAEALALDGTDGPSKVFEARCRYYIENPPPEGWDGVFVMKTK